MTDVRKVLLIAVRDYHAAVRTKAFVITVVLMPIMMAGGAVVQLLLKDVRDVADQRVGVLDLTPGATASRALEEAAARHNAREVVDPATGKQVKPRIVIEPQAAAGASAEALAQRRLELSERVRKGQLLGFAEIAAHVSATRPADPSAAAAWTPPVTHYSDRAAYMGLQGWINGAITEHVHAERFRVAGLDVKRVRELLQPVESASKGLARVDARTGKVLDARTEDRVAAMIVPIALVMLMFMMVMIGASPLLQSVVEEKTMRIAEVLLGSVRPFELMLGKLLGTVGVSLTLSALYLAGASYFAFRYGVADRLGPGLLAFFVVFQVLAVLMYGSLFIAVGAACTDLRETQSLLMPVMLLLVFPMFFLGHVMQYPHGPLAVGLSYFPPATPMLMMVRQASPPGIAWWQSAVAVLIVVAATLACVWAAGRIFRVGILMQGKGARFTELLRWVVRG